MRLKFSAKQPDAYRYLRTPEYRSIPKLRMVNIFMIGIMAAVFGGTVFFLYYRVYAVIGQIAQIASLQSQVAFETINFERLEKVQSAWNNKHAKLDLAVRRDPFVAVSSTKPNIEQ